MKGNLEDKIKGIQSHIPELNLTDKEIKSLTHQLELLETMLKELDEIDVENWEPAVTFTRREKA
ncbi:MAG: hypothetical protein HYU39_05335 [Thaumarchaeota archaeon]|nr:hypothetical protein [Nitrososphaerota archaeon]